MQALLVVGRAMGRRSSVFCGLSGVLAVGALPSSMLGHHAARDGGEAPVRPE